MSAGGTFSTEVFDTEIMPSSIASVAPILWVANEIELERPRVAYLCRFYSLRKRTCLTQPLVGEAYSN
jgi:callose synthase